MNNTIDIYNLLSGLVLTIALPVLAKKEWPVYYKGAILFVASILLTVLKAALANQLDLTSAHFWETASVIFTASQVLYQTFMKELIQPLYNYGVGAQTSSNASAQASATSTVTATNEVQNTDNGTHN